MEIVEKGRLTQQYRRAKEEARRAREGALPGIHGLGPPQEAALQSLSEETGVPPDAMIRSAMTLFLSWVSVLEGEPEWKLT